MGWPSGLDCVFSGWGSAAGEAAGGLAFLGVAVADKATERQTFYNLARTKAEKLR